VTHLPLSFSSELDRTTSRLVLHGDLDEGACVVLRDEIEAASASLTSGLTIDLSDVDFLPSAAVGVVATAQARAAKNGAELELVAREGSIAQRVLSICGVRYSTS